MFWITLIGIIVPTSYFYRYNIFLYLVKSYIYINQHFYCNDEKKVTHKNVIKINLDNDIIYINEFYCNTKKELTIVSNQNNEYFNGESYLIDEDLYELRNKIVHCSLQNEQNDILLDLTNIFRRFIFHFDKNDKYSKMKYFFNYLESLKNVKEINSLYFVVYKNDDHFTETRHIIKDILDKDYKDFL